MPLRGFGRWYGERQGETGDAWHRTLIDPGLLGRIGALPKGTRVLDLGCGNGYLARRFARAGARVVAVDRSRALLAAARERERTEPLGIIYQERDAARLVGLASGRFDLVFANMSLMDIARADLTIQETARVLRPGGRFVFSISHPCFDIDTRSTWEVVPGRCAGSPPTVYRKVTGYREPHADRYRWSLEDGREAETVGYHRPLGWYADRLRASGFVIVALDEPAPRPEYVGRRVPKGWIDAIPMHLVVEALRRPGLARVPGRQSSRPRRGGVPAA
jgi:SAM-dependent methyltransferase